MPIQYLAIFHGLRGFRPGLTQTGLNNYKRWLEAGNFGFMKQRDCTIYVAKTKALISFAVEPRCEKTGLRGLRPGPTQTGLYSYRRWLEA